MKLSLLPLLAFPLLVLAGCNSGGGSASTSATTATASTTTGSASAPLKVALLTSGDVNDQGWNQLGYEGLLQLKKDGDTVTNQVTKTDPERAPAMRDLADQGYNLLLLHGFEYGDAAKQIAPAYPDTKFVVVAGNVTQAPNVATLIPKLEDATYLLGIIAGKMTKTGKIGLIGGEDAPEIRSPFDSFTDGVKAANPSAVVLPTKYVGWDDQNLGKVAAQALIADGADILLHNADQAGKGMFAAAEEAKASGQRIYVFGSNADQNHVAPDITLASAVIDLPRAFENVAKSVQDGSFAPKDIELNLKNKTITLVWNPALKSQVPPDVIKAVDDASAKIKSGAIKIQRKV